MCLCTLLAAVLEKQQHMREQLAVQASTPSLLELQMTRWET